MQRSSCEVGLRARTAHPWEKRTASTAIRRSCCRSRGISPPARRWRRGFIQSTYIEFIIGNEFFEELRKARDFGWLEMRLRFLNPWERKAPLHGFVA